MDGDKDSAGVPFERFARAAARLLRAPIGLVSSVGEGSRIAAIGVPEALAESWSPASSLYAHTVANPGPTVVEDARTDERFKHDPFVSGPPHARFYAGIGLGGGGVLAVIDTRSRPAPALDELDALADLAAIATASIELSEVAAGLRLKLELAGSAERAAEVARAQAERSTQALRDSVRRLNHDLRNAVGGILGFADLLREDAGLTDQQREDVVDIYDAGQTILGLLVRFQEEGRDEGATSEAQAE